MRVLAGAALVLGAVLRIAMLPVGVPAVDDSWRAWSYHGAVHGPWNLYGPRGHTVSFGGVDSPVVYPPLALDEFALIGRAHLALNGGRFENDVALTETLKGAVVLLDAVLAGLVFVAVRRAANAATGWWAAMAYWLNPAVLLITTLGYVDVLVGIPAAGAVVAASCGRPWLSGALFAAAVTTKPQALFVGPVVALALWNAGGGAGLARVRAGVAAAAIAAAVIAAPVVAAGKTYYMLRSVAVLAGHDMLSALAFNLWWIVGYLFTAAAARAGGVGAALLTPPEIVTHGYVMARGFPNPRLIALPLLAVAVVWALTAARDARDLGLHAALGAFIVVSYVTLSVQVHENHFFLALPLLAIAASLRPAFKPVFAALSLSFALNLYVLFGLRGNGAPASVLTFTGIDLSVPLAAINCALFGWFAVVLRRECADPGWSAGPTRAAVQKA